MRARIEEYLAGPALLRKAVAGMTPEQLQARPVAGKWSTLEVVCHLCDFEPIFADRIKRVLAEDKPAILPADHDAFAVKLAYQDRDLNEELAIIEHTRSQLARILRTLKPEDWQRVGMHSVAGPRTVEELLKTVTNHIVHHAKFIQEKRQALGIPAA